jgi:polyhydroxyalkanoate synthesis regulator phasin
MKLNLSNMSKKSKSIAATAFILGVAAVSATTLGSTTALADTTANSTDARAAHITNLVTALSQKFNLNSSEVKTVVDTVLATEKTKMQAERAQNLATRLAKAVTDGKITQAQSNLITAKIQENKAFMESLKDKTKAERKTALKANKEALAKWATDNNIPKEFVIGPGIGMGMNGKDHDNHGGKKGMNM